MSEVVEHGAHLPVDDAAVDHVTAVAHVPEEATLPSVVMFPGAGGDLHGDGLVAFARVLSAAGAAVVRANLAHHEAGRRAPRADRSVAGLLQVVAGARELLRTQGVTRPVVVGGKSYGGRVASLAIAEQRPPDVVGLLFYGYPLHPPGKPEQRRVEHWPDVNVPCCFVQGTRDAFGGPDEIEPELRRLPRRATLVPVAGGDHSLKVSRGASPDDTARTVTDIVHGPVGDAVIGWLRTYRSW